MLARPPGCTHRRIQRSWAARPLTPRRTRFVTSPSSGITTCPIRAIDTAGLSPAGLRPCRLLLPSPVLTLACPPEAFPTAARLKCWLTYPPATIGLPIGLVPALGVGFPWHCVQAPPRDRQVPRAPLPGSGATSAGTASQGRLEGHCPFFFAPTGSCVRPNPSHRLRSLPRWMGLRRLLPAPAGRWPFPTLSPRILPQVPGPLPRRFLWCTCPFLPTGRRPSPRCNRVGFPQHPTPRLPCGPSFGAAAIPLRSGPRVCSPPRSLPPLWLCATGWPWLLRPSRTRVVTFPCIGYACRPNRAIDGVGTLTPPDSRPCRPLLQHAGEKRHEIESRPTPRIGCRGRRFLLYGTARETRQGD